MDYAAIRTNAAKAIAKAGQSMTLRRSADSAFDPVTGGTLTSPTVETWQVNGVVTNFNSMDRLTAANRDGSMIQTGDRKVILEAKPDVVPLPGDELLVGNTTWKLIAVDPIDPAGTAVIYKGQVRK